MFVCACRAVTDRTIRRVIAEGATTIEEIRQRSGAGSVCMGCWPELDRLLAHRGTRAHGADEATSHGPPE